MQNSLRFIKTLKSFVDIPDVDIEKILKITRSKQILKGGYFIREGEMSRNFGFVQTGLLRYSYTDDRGNDFTKGFFGENSFICSYSAMIQNRVSYFSIEALENSDIFEINYEEWKRLFANELWWNKFLIALLEKGYCIKENREREFLLFSAEERYKSFLNTYPGLDKRIRQNLIASYIGITPVALSRIRKKFQLT